MEDAVHGPLEGGTGVFRMKGHDLVCKCTPRGSECFFVLICVADLNFFVP